MMIPIITSQAAFVSDTDNATVAIMSESVNVIDLTLFVSAGMFIHARRVPSRVPLQREIG